MTTNEISEIVIKDLSQRAFPIFLTTFAGQGIQEADVFGVNKNGYMYEYEIKRSITDYMADFRNKDEKHLRLKNRNSIHVYDEWVRGKRTGCTYELLKIPNRFYFVCEDGLIPVSKIPEYAGLLYVRGNKLIEIKNAPMLHKNKANERLYARIASVLSQRIVYGCSFYTHIHKIKTEQF